MYKRIQPIPLGKPSLRADMDLPRCGPHLGDKVLNIHCSDLPFASESYLAQLGSPFYSAAFSLSAHMNLPGFLTKKRPMYVDVHRIHVPGPQSRQRNMPKRAQREVVLQPFGVQVQIPVLQDMAHITQRPLTPSCFSRGTWLPRTLRRRWPLPLGHLRKQRCPTATSWILR